MAVLAELMSPLVANKEEYTAKLFPNGFSRRFFDWLATVSLDFCLQIIIRYFPVTEESPEFYFIKAQYPLLTLEDIKEMKNYPATTSSSFLFVALQGWIQYHIKGHHYYATASQFLNKLLQENCGVEQTNQEGDTLLLYALKHPSVSNIS